METGATGLFGRHVLKIVTEELKRDRECVTTQYHRYMVGSVKVVVWRWKPVMKIRVQVSILLTYPSLFH